MAALCTGNYGLSQNCTDDSKEYFFVKLTDSAYRAVEEYQRNQNKYNTHATIQILENGGILSFPTTSGNVGQQFSFSIDEIEGSFECIRQTQNQLDVLGSLPYKMRVHANEDVYETTRYRMAVAEENQKNKCTREIKPNQTDIGRKVKLKNSSNRLTNIPQKRDQALTNTSQSPLSSLTNSSTALSSNAIVNGSTSTTSPIVINGSSSSSFASTNLNGPPNSGSINSCSNIRNNNLTTSSLNSITSNSSKLPPNCNSSSTGLATAVSSAFSLSSALSSAAGSGTSGIISGYFSNSNTGIRPANGLIVGNSSLNGAGSRRGTTGVTGNNSRGQKNGSRHTPDISKRKIRERLIHLLALKPFKKPELYTRLQNEGIRDREKSLISAILKEISTMRDNTYNLKRQVWNDVNEDWPFYTEQEIQMLKRRKPQNLTPPLSSDGGSSTSGQSPTSTHNGSPPPAVKRPSLDRDRFYEEPIAKKQRISHFRKDANEINSSSIASSKHQQESEDNHMSLSYSVLGTEATRRISPREEVNNGNNNSYQQINSHHHSSNNNCSSNKNSNNVGINSNGNGRQQSPSSYSHLNCSNKSNSSDDSRRQSSSPVTVGNLANSISTSPGIGSQNCISTIDMTDPEATIPSTKPCHNQGSSNMNSNSTGGQFKNNANDFSRFTKITSIEQRRLYKTEFENDYDEYRELLNKIESVGQRFKVLAQRLNNARNNDANYRVIKRQILAEYEKINRDHEHKRTRARFDHLHAKLAHIKALVSEFDKTITSSSSPSSVPALNSDQCGNYNANRNRLSSTSPLQNLGSSVHMSNGSNSNITNPSGTLRTSPNSHSIAQAYLTSSSSPNLHHVPKQENY